MSSILYTPGFRMLCVDPGLRGCGVAEFEAGVLKRAAYVKNSATLGRGYAEHRAMADALYAWYEKMPPVPMPDLVVVEFPRIYPGSAQQKGDLNDLIDVACVGSAIASMTTSKVESIYPADWKGQVPKDVMTERIKRALDDEEKSRAEKCAASLSHNMWDSAGIGLYKLNRLNKKVYGQ